MPSQAELYRFHVENFRSVDRGLNRIGRLLRSAISNGDGSTEIVLQRLYALLLGAWAECRLRKLLFEHQGFNAAERKRITARKTLLDEWLATVEVSFRKHYSVPRARLSEGTLPHSANTRYTSLRNLLDQHLRPVIELRNKLAHGQWVYLLNNENTDINPTHMAAIQRENLLSLQFKKSLLEYISTAIHDLVVSAPTFERDFDRHYRHVVEVLRNLTTRDYSQYRSQMREKFRRGREKADLREPRA